MSRSGHRLSHKERPQTSRKPEKKTGAFGVSLTDYLKGKELFVLLLLILSVVLAVFKDFLLLQTAYLFKDIGSDSINGNYPQIVHIVDYLKTEGIPRWSFNQGMGQTMLGVVTFDPFVLAFYLFGRENVAYGPVYVEAIKIGGCFKVS